MTMINTAISRGLSKAFMYGQAFAPDRGTPEAQLLPTPLLQAALTALTLQLMSLCDDGFGDFIRKKYHGQEFSTFGRKITFLKDHGDVLDAEAVEHLRLLRNELSHDSDAHATWEQWHDTYEKVHKELQHLQVIPEES